MIASEAAYVVEELAASANEIHEHALTVSKVAAQAVEANNFSKKQYKHT